MALEIKEVGKSEIEITGEVPSGDFMTHYKKTLDSIRKDIKVDGFRPGKATDEVIEGKVGADTILRDAAERAVQEQYPKIVREKKLEVVGQPTLIITKIAKGNPLGFKIKTAIIPSVSIDDHKKRAQKVRKEHTPDTDVTNADLDNAVDNILKSHKAEELNDELVKTLGDYDNVASFKTALKQNLEAEKKRKDREKLRMEMLDNIASTINDSDIPDAMIEMEQQKLLGEMRSYIAHSGLVWEEYLKHINKSEEDLLSGWTGDATKRVKYSLVLDAVADAENITAKAEDVKKQVDIVMQQAENAGNKELDRERVTSYTYSILRNEEVLKFLENCK